MEKNYNIETYRRIRRSIGYLGISLPIVLVIFSLIPFFKTDVQTSISEFYFTNLREIFTGILCALGLFLIRYEGFKSSKFWRNDDLLTNIAGFMAVGIAFFPTNPKVWSQKIYTLIPYDKVFLGWVHYFFAALFFTILAIISIWVFTIGQNSSKDLPKSFIDENNIYKTCGIIIFICIGLIFLFSITNWYAYSTLLFEAIALFAFGVSWLIKGRALGSRKKLGQKIYREKSL